MRNVSWNRNKDLWQSEEDTIPDYELKFELRFLEFKKKKKKMKRAKLIETKRIEWLIYSKILTGCWSACGLTELFRSEKICRFATATVNIAFTFIWSGVEGPRWNKSHASTTSALTIVRWQIANVTHRLNSVCEVINKLVNI
jgi:hypothetical protein